MCSRLRNTRCRTRTTTSIKEHVQIVQIFTKLNSQLCSRFVTMNRESLLWYLPTWTTYCMTISRKELKSRTLRRKKFLKDKEEHDILRFCNKEFRQEEDFDIHDTVKNNTERVQSITNDAKHDLTRKTTADEINQLSSVTQSLVWIKRKTCPDLSYRISKIQCAFANVCGRDPRECNRIIEYASSTSTRDIYFPQGFLQWYNGCDDQWRKLLSRRGTTWSNHNKLVS